MHERQVPRQNWTGLFERLAADGAGATAGFCVAAETPGEESPALGLRLCGCRFDEARETIELAFAAGSRLTPELRLFVASPVELTAAESALERLLTIRDREGTRTIVRLRWRPARRSSAVAGQGNRRPDPAGRRPQRELPLVPGTSRRSQGGRGWF